MNLLDTDERHLASSSLKPANRWTFIAGFALISQADALGAFGVTRAIIAALVTPNEDFQFFLEVAPAKTEQSSGGGCGGGGGVGYNFEEDFGPCAA